MLYTITEWWGSWMDARGIGWFARLMSWTEFRAFAAALLAFLIVLFAGAPTIRWLVRRKIGDQPEFHLPTLNDLMRSKRQVPTMGGILLCGAVLVTTLLLADVVHSRLVQLAMIVMAWLAVVGGFDDWLKLTAATRSPGSRQGLYAWEKLLFQLGIGALAGYFVYQHGLGLGADALVLNLPLQRTYLPMPIGDAVVQAPALNASVIVLGFVPFMIIATLLIAGTSNAVNLTDGLDGLAPGVLAIAAGTMAVFCFVAGNSSVAYLMLFPHVAEGSELMVVAAAMVGACLGFLWYNAAPAQVFMGDTGSLAMGGLLAFIAVAIRQEVLLIVIGGIFFAEMASVIMQVGWFKWTGGKRIFRCAPIHHHFHMGGLPETKVVARFWLVTILLCLLALVSLRLR